MTVDTVKDLINQVLGHHIGVVAVGTARLVHISGVMQRQVVRCAVTVKTGHGEAVHTVIDRIDHAMVSAISQVGHVMGKATIAEWVEDEVVLDQLRAMGVDFAQGYGLGKPVPVASLLRPRRIASYS